MAKTNLSRADYFVNSLTVICIVAVIFFLSLHFTIGYQGLLNSAPGKARGGLVAITFVLVIILVVIQSGLAKRRAADANLSRLHARLFIALMYLNALAYSAQLFYYDFKYPDNNEGSLTTFLFGLCAYWGIFCAAASVETGSQTSSRQSQSKTRAGFDLSRVSKERSNS